MRRAFLGSIAMCLAGAGVSLAQPWGPPPPAPPGYGLMPPPGAYYAPAPPVQPNWGGWPSPEARGEVPPPALPLPPSGPACPACGPQCPPACDDCCEPCPIPPPPPCPEPYVIYSWASIEHLRWQVKDAPLPVPLVTSTNNLVGIAPAQLGEEGTIVVYGARAVDLDTGHGMKVACGVYDPSVNLGLEGSVFRLEDLVARFEDRVEANENRFLARPFFNTQTQLQDISYLALPGASYGGITISSSNRFWGAEGNVAGCVCSGDGFNIDLLGGFRYFDLKEGLRITDSTVIMPGAGGFFNGSPVAEGQIVRQDNFDTRNKFYGGQFGVRTEAYLGKFFANFKGLVAVGTNHTSSTIRGHSQLFSPSGDTLGYTTAGGLLALRSNGVKISQDGATVIPVFEANVGADICGWLRVYAGYNFMYWGSVTRPGDQVSVALDPRSIPTSQFYDQNFRSTLPRNPLDRSDFWAQGLSFGIAIRF